MTNTGALTDKERAFLRTSKMDETIIESMDDGQVVTATGPVFMSWLRHAFVEGMRHERTKIPAKRWKMRLYGRASRTVHIRSKRR